MTRPLGARGPASIQMNQETRLLFTFLSERRVGVLGPPWTRAWARGAGSPWWGPRPGECGKLGPRPGQGCGSGWPGGAVGWRGGRAAGRAVTTQPGRHGRSGRFRPGRGSSGEWCWDNCRPFGKTEVGSRSLLHAKIKPRGIPHSAEKTRWKVDACFYNLRIAILPKH